jgi:4-amino-4-deoxy-L-arabinose transferase-like glycosyltransferase
MTPERTGAGLAAAVVLAVAVFFTGLGASPLWDEDETRFASVARDMARGGDWVVPRFNGELADKPAGLFWLIAAGFALGGETPAAARSGSAVCGVVAVVMTWLLGNLFHGRRTAFWSAAAMSTALLVVVEARAATTDAALLAVTTAMLWLAACAWWKSGKCVLAPWRRRTAVAIGVLAGAGIMLKGLVALVVPLACFIVFALWAGPRENLGRRVQAAWSACRVPLTVLVAVLVAAPWHAAVAWRTGGAWLELFYWKHHFGRAVSVMEGHGGWPLLQLPWLLAGLFPWSVFLPLALWRTLRTTVTGGDDAVVAKFLLAWSAVWIGLFSLTATQLPNYVLPAYPALCICVAHLVVRAIEKPGTLKNGWFYAACGGLLSGSLVMAGGAWFASHATGEGALLRLAWLSVIPAAGAGWFAAAVARGRRRAGLVVFLGAGLALVAALFLVAAPRVAKLDPVGPMLARADQIAGGCASLATWRYSAPGTVWLAGRHVPVCRSAGEAAAFLRAGAGSSFLLADAGGWTELDSLGPGEFVVLEQARPLLRREKIVLVGVR